MATNVIKTIAPSGGDYTSMSAWLAVHGGDIVTRDTNEIAEFETFSGGLDDNSAFVGCTTDSTHKFILRPAAGHEHVGNITGGFYFNRTSGNPTIRPISTCNDMELTGLSHTGSVGFYSGGNGGGVNNVYEKCIIADGPGLDIPSTAKIQNCLLIRPSGDGIINRGGNVIGATVYGSGNRGIVVTSGAVTKNCISVNNVGVDFSYQGGTHDYNLSEDSTATDTNSINNAVIKNNVDLPLTSGIYIIFNDTTSDDYSLVSDSNNNAEASGVSVTGWTDDIIGTSRPSNPSIGAFEIVASGGSTITVTGVQASGAAGTLTTTSDASIAITGVSATGAVGALTISTGANASVALTGIESIGQVGSLAVLSSPTITLTGVNATGQVGALSTVSGTSITISGVTSTGEVGSLSIQSDTTVTLGGLSASGQAGTVIIPQGANVTPVGVAATGAAGILTVSLSGEWVIQAQAGGTWTMQPQSSDTWTEQPITSKTWTIQ